MCSPPRAVSARSGGSSATSSATTPPPTTAPAPDFPPTPPATAGSAWPSSVLSPPKPARRSPKTAGTRCGHASAHQTARRHGRKQAPHNPLTAPVTPCRRAPHPETTRHPRTPRETTRRHLQPSRGSSPRAASRHDRLVHLVRAADQAVLGRPPHREAAARRGHDRRRPGCTDQLGPQHHLDRRGSGRLLGGAAGAAAQLKETTEMDTDAMTPEEDRWDDDLDALLDRKGIDDLKNAVGVACETRDVLRQKAADFARLAAEGK